MKKNKKLDLPKYCFARGNRIWVRLKREDNKWKNTPTPYTLEQADQARRYVKSMLRGIEMKRDSKDPNLTTVMAYGEHWLKDRERRGIASHVEERSRLEKYVYPYIGTLTLEEVRPRHLRDMVRELKVMQKAGKLAARTVIHIFRTTRTMFASAVIDELITGNPCVLEPGELPKKVDADPEWRMNASFTKKEVQALLSNAIIPAERRVMYALKALAGLRHGEAAALCWRHVDDSHEPLAKMQVVQAFSSRHGEIKRVKTEIVRAVPVHPVLARILRAWRDRHWKRIYGREPTRDDLVVPTRTMNCVTVKDANEAFKRDLDALGLRKEAGTQRDRGGHDLRSWYSTRLIEDEAESLIVRRTTHAPPKDVNGGYERFSWETICREISKLSLTLTDEEILPLVTRSLQAEAKAAGRWQKSVTPSGLEADSKVGVRTIPADVSVEKRAVARRLRRMSGQRVTNVTRPSTAAGMLERAVALGDFPRVLEIAKMLREEK